MKKNVVALLLSVVLASGSLGGAPAMAAETVEQQTAVSEDEAAQLEEETVDEEPTQQTEVAKTGISETDVVDENDYLEAESAVESDVSEEDNAEESNVADIEGAGVSNANYTTEQEIIEESPDVETDKESPVSVEETEISDTGSSEEPQEEAEISGNEAMQDNVATADPAKAGTAIKGEVEDVSSDLKVAEDAEKLKSGKWKEVTKTVHHAEEGHYETVPVVKDIVDEAAWDEPVYETYARCSECGSIFETGHEAGKHVVIEHNNEASWDTVDVQVETIHHPAKTHKETVYEKQWVVDKAAWDEQVKTGTYQYIVNGKPVKNKLVAIGNETYYFDANGIAVTGWKEVNGSRMYFGSDRKMKTTRSGCRSTERSITSILMALYIKAGCRAGTSGITSG